MSYQQYCSACGTVFTALGMRSKCNICFDREARTSKSTKEEDNTVLFFIGWSAFAIFAMLPFFMWLGEKFDFSNDAAGTITAAIYFGLPVLIHLFSDDA